jgi:hypothetical protein
MKILTERFIELTSNKHDCTWMEVDSLQEKVQLTEAKMQQKMSQVGKITTTLEQLKVIWFCVFFLLFLKFI